MQVFPDISGVQHDTPLVHMWNRFVRRAEQHHLSYAGTIISHYRTQGVCLLTNPADVCPHGARTQRDGIQTRETRTLGMGNHLYILRRVIDSEEPCTDGHETVTMEFSPRARKLRRLVQTLKPGSTLLVPTLFNLGDLEAIPSILRKCFERRIKIAFTGLNFVFDPDTPEGAAIAVFCGDLLDCKRLQNREAKKRASLVSRFLGTQARRSCSSELRAEAERLLRSGLGVRATARAMKGKISKTTVGKIAKSLRG